MQAVPMGNDRLFHKNWLKLDLAAVLRRTTVVTAPAPCTLGAKLSHTQGHERRGEQECHSCSAEAQSAESSTCGATATAMCACDACIAHLGLRDTSRYAQMFVCTQPTKCTAPQLCCYAPHGMVNVVATSETRVLVEIRLRLHSHGTWQTGAQLASVGLQRGIWAGLLEVEKIWPMPP